MGLISKLFGKNKIAEKPFDYKEEQKQRFEYVKKEVEKLLLRHSFEPIIVKLPQKTIYGQEEINCYKRGELYCDISYFGVQNYCKACKKVHTGYVMLEYADSLFEAERWIFEDGDGVPLDLPIEQIIYELNEELRGIM